MDNYLWKFHWDCGRSGYLRGLFVATEEEINDIIGNGTIEENEITKIDLDLETVEKVTKILGKTWSGYNPLNYIRYECKECEDSYSIDEFNKELDICTYCESKKENL